MPQTRSAVQNPPPQYPTAGAAPGAEARSEKAEFVLKHTPEVSSVKETIESILVAFILAFIFRAFIVEAFVIPTGSMAPTLLGAHMRFRCPDCGYVFDVNYSRGDSDDLDFPSDALSPDDIYCPNCGFKAAAGPVRDANGHMQMAQTADRQYKAVYSYGTPLEQVRFGDRILVLKYAYLFNEPQRWDVVVFKSPDDPAKNHYTQNFIKRMVGKPGESLMVLDGDIYIDGGDGNWQVQRKPDAVQEAMWRIVYDNDHYPQGLARSDRPVGWTQPWKVRDGNGWNLGAGPRDGRVFRFAAKDAATLSYDASANPAVQTTNDYLVYDIPSNQRRPNGASMSNGDEDRNIVSDLKLSLWYERQQGDGPLKLRLTKRDHGFIAEIDGNTATLWHETPDGQTTAIQGPVALPVAAGQPMALDFRNVDYRVSLRIDGKVLLQTTPSQYGPDVLQLRNETGRQSTYATLAHRPPTIEIAAANQSCALSHVSLWRDVYYTNSSSNSMIRWGTPNNPVHLHRQGDKRPDGSTYDDDEYFTMGDNSLISGDARYWNVPIDLPYEGLNMEAGRVPGRFMLGKAFFVYWPAGYRPVDALPPLIPNFGDMRFIH